MQEVYAIIYMSSGVEFVARMTIAEFRILRKSITTKDKTFITLWVDAHVTDLRVADIVAVKRVDINEKTTD